MSYSCHFVGITKPNFIFLDLCIGTDEEKDDIFPCTWVGHNISGTIMIDDGWLTINGMQVRRLSEFNPIQPNVSEAERLSDSNNVFRMEPGRTLFMMTRICNDAMLCTNKTLGSIIILDNNSELKTSLDGSAITISVAGGSSGRKKRAVGDDLVIETPSSK